MRWLEGRLFAAQGLPSEALERLSEVQRQLAGFKLPCDAAIVALEMAILHLEAGRTREVRVLAEEVVPVFEVEAIERERLGAVRLFVEAARKEAATVAMAFNALEELRKGRG
ncbi:MAG TPA: hypothetical protein VN783_02190 [Thermoanaerobaculia bacterium]|nr:hypothetical protein [Thermoanaerobaculia bacterium]